MHQTSLILQLPLSDCCISLSAAISSLNYGQDREGFADTIDPISSHWLHGCAFVPFGRAMDLIYKHPHLRQLHLDSVTVHLPGPTSTLSQVPWFSLLETLTIKPRTTQSYDGGLVTTDLLFLLARMPRLRNLGVYGPKSRERADNAGHGLQHRDLPCSLETLVLFGIVPAPISAHIISQSRRTLRELTISFLGHTDAEEALLVGAIAQAAPRLCVRAGGASQLRRMRFPQLARLDSLYLEVPRQATLQATLDALCDAPLRALSIKSTHDLRRAREPEQVDVLRLRMPSLRSVVFLGFAFDDDVQRELVAYMQARRIRCLISV